MKHHNAPCLVWLPADHRMLGEEDGGQPSPFLVLGEKYATAITRCAQAQPVLFPLAGAATVVDLLALVDGVMLTGSPANVHPSHFGEDVADASLPLDPRRDALTLELVRQSVALGVPLLGVCRGFQEINVALGGTLHQRVHRVPGMLDHREGPQEPLAQQYAPRHEIRIEPGSVLAQWAGGAVARVNSLHGQGVARLAPGLQPLAYAPDGLVEAFSIRDAGAFAFAFQWHPEWLCWETPLYAAIFKAFGEACRQRQQLRLQGPAPSANTVFA
jgi:putative glutamine amidotransferase